MNSKVYVKVAENINKRDYTDEGHLERVKFRGQEGHIIAHHDSHGLCYDVQFEKNGWVGKATYDPDELVLIK